MNHRYIDLSHAIHDGLVTYAAVPPTFKGAGTFPVRAFAAIKE
jgi:kynurenine formamidase